MLRASLVKDLGGDLSTMQGLLVDRVVHKTVKCWFYERGVIDGDGQASRDFYLATCNSLRLDLCALGLERRVKDITTDLEAYLKKKAEEDPPHSQSSSSDPASGVDFEDEASGTGGISASPLLSPDIHE